MPYNNCIIIPIYKNDNLEYSEIESIHNTLTLMYKYDIFFICPNKINIQYYINEFINKYNRNNIHFKYFDDFYFENIYNYSLLCVSDFFYEYFLNYDYMLICQPDAWIFYDNLEYFCNKGYDYLGAFVLFSDKKITEYDLEKSDQIMNGGFSLRNIKNFYNVISKNKEIILKEYFIWNKIYGGVVEDGFICTVLYKYLNIPLYKKLDLQTIFEFSGETRCEEIYPNLCNKLPFGCHQVKHYIEYIFKKHHIEYIFNKNKF